MLCCNELNSQHTQGDPVCQQSHCEPYLGFCPLFLKVALRCPCFHPPTTFPHKCSVFLLAFAITSSTLPPLANTPINKAQLNQWQSRTLLRKQHQGVKAKNRGGGSPPCPFLNILCRVWPHFAKNANVSVATVQFILHKNANSVQCVLQPNRQSQITAPSLKVVLSWLLSKSAAIY